MQKDDLFFLPRFAANLTKTLKTRQQLQDFVGFVECENPNPKLDNFLGRLTSISGTTASSSSANPAVVGEDRLVDLSGAEDDRTEADGGGGGGGGQPQPDLDTW